MISLLESRRESGELDLPLIIAVFILLGVSISMIYSASFIKSLALYGDRYFILKSQVLWMLIGILALIIVSNVDHRIYERHSRWILIGVLVLMLLSFIPGISHQVGKARRWIKLGFMGGQPSEFVKIALVIYLAGLLARKKEEIFQYSKVFLPALVVTGVFVALIILQSNLGTALIVMGLFFFMMIIAGVRFSHLLLTGLGAVPFIVLTVVKEAYRQQRIFAYLNPWQYPDTIGYNIIQSMQSFRSGGLLGMGFGQSLRQTIYLPAPHTDFIMAVAAEEAGVLGILLIIIVFTVILVRGLAIASAAKEDFSKFLAAGLTIIIISQALINMGVVTGILPTTGIVLPFISYGGSSLIANMIAVGMLLNIHRFNVENRGVAS